MAADSVMTFPHHIGNKSGRNQTIKERFFGTLITKGKGHQQVFLFSHLTYFVHLLYLGKLSKPRYRQKIKQNHESLQRQ